MDRKRIILWVSLVVLSVCLLGCKPAESQIAAVEISKSSTQEQADAALTLSSSPVEDLAATGTNSPLLQETPTVLNHTVTMVPKADIEGLRLTIIYDNYAFDDRLVAEWGFGALVEFNGHVVLFDTGGSAGTFMSNLHILGIDPKQVEAVVISHKHDDHTAGLLPFLEEADHPAVYLLASTPSSLKLKVEAQTELIEVVQPVEIFPGMYSTGKLSAGGIDEQGLVIDRGEDIVVITGCAHPGVVNIVRQARMVVQPGQNIEYKPVALVLGGFHLMRASQAEVESIIADLKALGVQQVSPTHCTGDEAIALFSEYFGTGYIAGGVGKIVTMP